MVKRATSSTARSTSRQTILAHAVAHAIAALLASLPAYAQQQEITRSYRVAPGPLTSVLKQFGSDASIMLSFSNELTQGLQSPGINGTRTAAEGLAQGLAGSGLVAVRQEDGSFIVQKAAAGSSQADTPLPLVTVHGAAETATSHVNGYAAKRTATATKTDTPIEEIPQSISVVTSDQITTTGARTLQDALGYTAGVSAEQGSYGVMTSESFFIRGFEVQPYSGGILRDGMKYQPNVYNGAQEVYGLERVEVLKGASSILYGTAAPGGLINAITKRPTAESLREINVEYGNHNRKQISGDISGPLDDAGELTYRLTALERKADSFADFGKNDRTYLAAALTWSPSAATSLTLLSSYQHSKTTDNGPLPRQGTLLFNPNGQLPGDRYLGEPSFNLFDNTQKTVSSIFEHAFSDTLKFRQSLRYFTSSLDYKYYQITGVGTDLRTVSRRGRAFLDSTEAVTADTNLEYSFDTGPVAHKVLLGVDYLTQRHTSDRANTTFTDIDMYNPVYGQPFGSATDTDKWRLKQSGTGLYLQDQLKIADKWVLLVGGRQDWTRLEDRDLLNNPDGIVQTDKAFSGRAGLVYLANNGLSPYVSFSQSFAPEEGFDRLRNAFKPTRGEQYEVGLRYQTPDKKLLLSAAIYQLTQSNVQTPDPVDPDNFSVQTGEVRSRGVELEAKGALTKNLNISAAYSLISAETTKSNNPTEIGATFAGVPRSTVSLWMDYRFSIFGLPNLRAGAGVRYIGGRPGNASGLPDQPAYALVDAMVAYEMDRWRYAINATNLANRLYVPSPCFGRSCTYGQPRTIVASASYRF